MKLKTVIFGSLLASLAFVQAHAQTTQVETCLDSPAIKAGSGFSSCVKKGCGPTYNTDLVRTAGAGGAQPWEPWATVASSTNLVACTAGKITSTWLAKSLVTANPPAPPSTTPPPAPKVGNYNLTWTMPTANADNSVIDPTVTIQYSVQHGSSATGPWDAAITQAGLSYQFKNLLVTVKQCFAVSAFEIAAGSSNSGLSSPVVLCADANSVGVAMAVPGSVNGLKLAIEPVSQ